MPFIQGSIKRLVQAVTEPTILDRHSVAPIGSAHNKGGHGPDIRLKRDEEADEDSQGQGV
jgi:hypothetical protein